MSKHCIIIQGPIHDQQRMVKSWEGFNTIYSTWDDEKQKIKCSKNVICNKKPENSGYKNFNYQLVTSLAGLKKAKKKGFEFSVKWRSDYIPSNPTNLFKIFDKEKLNFIAWSSHGGGYLVDYFFAGKTEYLLKIFEKMQALEKDYPRYFPEKKLTIATKELVEEKSIKPNYLLNKFDESNYCTFIRKGKDFDSVNTVWKDDEYWQSDSTKKGKWGWE
tara:strand:+ start:10719 stop:11369 length:651 start_codon:yes stop_codon:yes gene_type:complete